MKKTEKKEIVFIPCGLAKPIKMTMKIIDKIRNCGGRKDEYAKKKISS